MHPIKLLTLFSMENQLEIHHDSCICQRKRDEKHPLVRF
ncbi:hypothetical protein B4107_3628 [Bacillus safensis]|nr:hypothetical protein B4107_3628 [Bacillus safensis]